MLIWLLFQLYPSLNNIQIGNLHNIPYFLRGSISDDIIMSTSNLDVDMTENTHRILADTSTSTTATISPGTRALYVIMIFVCILSASLACGLTQGLLSLNPLELNIKMRNGDEMERQRAKKVLPLITQHHLLLVSLMLFNATANEALPLFLDQLVPPYVTIILSVSLVVIFGEIVPSAIFTGPNQLEIASKLTNFTWVIITILYPIAMPISVALDMWLGRDDGMTIFNRSEIYTMLQIQQEEGPKRGISSQETVMNEEVIMIGGALRLRDISVQDVMTKDVFMLSINDKLTIKTLSKIFNSGCSRVPIYDTDRSDVVGLMLVKDLLFVDPEDELPIRNFMLLFGRSIPYIRPDEKLINALKLFKQTHIHIAVVGEVICDEHTYDKSPMYTMKGIITMEDIFEELLGDEIYDETDTAEIHAMYSSNRNINSLQLQSKPGLNPLVDFAQLKSFTGTSMKDDNQLSEEEIKEVIHVLQTSVPQIQVLFGDDIAGIEKLVRDSKVMFVSLDNVDSASDLILRPSPASSPRHISPSITKMDSIRSKNYIYKRDKVFNACTLVLNGQLKVIRDSDPKKEIDIGPYELIGSEALSSEEGIFVSNFSAYIASDELRCLRIMKPNYLSSKLNIKTRGQSPIRFTKFSQKKSSSTTNITSTGNHLNEFIRTFDRSSSAHKRLVPIRNSRIGLSGTHSSNITNLKTYGTNIDKTHLNIPGIYHKQDNVITSIDSPVVNPLQLHRDHDKNMI